MKPIIVFVITFVVATAASTGAKVVMTPAKVAVDSTKADSTKADSLKAAGDSTAKGADTAAVASGQTTPPPTPDTAKAVAEGVKPQTPGTTPAATPTTQVANAGSASAAKANAPSAVPDTAATDSEKRIAKVFTAMDAKQAAKVLEHMSDGDVRIILGYVGVKQAAQIMAALPPERVATLSKLALGKTK